MDGAQYTALRIKVKRTRRKYCLTVLVPYWSCCVTWTLFPQGMLSSDYMVEKGPWRKGTKGNTTKQERNTFIFILSVCPLISLLVVFSAVFRVVHGVILCTCSVWNI